MFRELIKHPQESVKIGLYQTDISLGKAVRQTADRRPSQTQPAIRRMMSRAFR